MIIFACGHVHCVAMQKKYIKNFKKDKIYDLIELLGYEIWEFKVAVVKRLLFYLKIYKLVV